MDLELIIAVISISIVISSIISTIVYNLLLRRLIDESLEKFRFNLQNEAYVKQRRWELKRDACLKALEIADSLISHGNYPNVKDGDIIQQDSSTEEIRSCINLIASSCESKEVLEVFKNIIRGEFSPDIIVDLRNAVRKELDFGNEQIDNDRESAFIGRTTFDEE